MQCCNDGKELIYNGCRDLLKEEYMRKGESVIEIVAWTTVYCRWTFVQY